MAGLLLGPLLRYVSERDAVIWVEADARCTVEVRAGDVTASEPTFTVAGHHYALVVLQGLPPCSSTPYEVRLDADRVWPEPGSRYPASRIRTVDPSQPIRLLGGSCREPPGGRHVRSSPEPDVLDAYAARMAGLADDQWPEAFLMVGDQLYADETSAAVQAFIRQRRDPSVAPYLEVADFEEYTRLYYESWREPNVRWLLSTLSSAMIFDDHDVRDDWNTSHAWREEMRATAWWEERITGALMSYWLYQHLGNLSPAALAEDEMYGRVRAASDGEELLRAYVQAADREADGAKGAMWSYRRDLGPVRVVVVDSRCGRILADGRRSMVSEAEFRWLETQAQDGEFDHLVIATSLPWLLPRALHDLESFDEALAAGSRGKTLARFGEWLRRAIDLEHWAAFRQSFDRLGRLLVRVGRGEHGSAPPATICILSGDVHHTYVSRAEFRDRPSSLIYQITCSPMNNTIERLMQVVFRVGWSRSAERFTSALARWAGVPRLRLTWHHPSGPHFGNILALLVFDGRTARVSFERSVRPQKKAAEDRTGDSKPMLAVVADLALTDLPATKPA